MSDAIEIDSIVERAPNMVERQVPHLPLDPRATAQGFNNFIHATHRQNFIAPPRAHRSFPLAELLTRL